MKLLYVFYIKLKPD